MLAVIGKDGRYNAIVYHFACHPANTRDLTVSADYPGDVQQGVSKSTGLCGPHAVSHGRVRRRESRLQRERWANEGRR